MRERAKHSTTPRSGGSGSNDRSNFNGHLCLLLAGNYELLLTSPRGERSAARATSFSHYLRNNRECDFFRTHCANVESDGRSDLSQLVFAYAGLAKPVDNDRRAPFTPNQSDIIRFCFNYRTHALLVFAVTSRDNRYSNSAAICDHLAHSRIPITR